MKILRSSSFLLVFALLAASVSARQTENASFTDARVQATVQDGPTGTVVTVQNFYSQPITAYLVDLRQALSPEQIQASADAHVKSLVTKVHSEHLSDCIATPLLHKPIAPNQVQTFLALPASPSSKMQRTIQLLAVIFADGTSAGEPDSITRLVAIRKMHWTHLTEILALTQQEEKENAPLEQVLADLKTAREAKGPLSPKVDRDDWNIADGLYRTAILNINEDQQSSAPLGLHAILELRVGEYTKDLKVLNSSSPPINAPQEPHVAANY